MLAALSALLLRFAVDGNRGNLIGGHRRVGSVTFPALVILLRVCLLFAILVCDSGLRGALAAELHTTLSLLIFINIKTETIK